MAQSEIDAVRALLSSKPRPVGWPARRKRLDEVGAVWPVADDVEFTAVDVNGMPGEYSVVPGSDPSRVLMFFHGGGYCSGSIQSHRRLVTEAGRAARMRTLAVGYRLAPEHPFPAAYDDALTAWRFLRNQGIAAARHCDRWRQRRGRTHSRIDRPVARRARGASRMRVAHFAMDGSDDVRFDPGEQSRGRSADSQRISERISGCLSSRWHGQKRPPRLSALRRFQKLSSDANPGWP